MDKLERTHVNRGTVNKKNPLQCCKEGEGYRNTSGNKMEEKDNNRGNMNKIL